MTLKLASRGGLPVRANFLPYALPQIGEEEKQEVMEALDSGWITTGPRVARFETALAEYTGAKHVVCLDSGTAALHLALLALHLRPGEEVITTALTFCSTVNSIVHAGGRPILADIDPETLNLSPLSAERATTSKTRAVLPVHFGGQACDMSAFLDLGRSKKVKVVEDAAHAVGAIYQDTKIGNLGDATCFSFYANKNMTTAEGGAYLTNNEAWADEVRLNALHGMSRDAWKRYTKSGSWKYDVVTAGYKYNMSDVAAAIGIHQLDRLDTFIERRRDLARRYRKAFDASDYVEPLRERQDLRHAYHLFVVKLRLDALTIDRAGFIEELREEGIGTTVNFIPIHHHSYYRDTLGAVSANLPATEAAYPRLLSLPLYPRMTPEDVADVVAAVNKVGNAFRR